MLFLSRAYFLLGLNRDFFQKDCVFWPKRSCYIPGGSKALALPGWELLRQEDQRVLEAGADLSGPGSQSHRITKNHHFQSPRITTYDHKESQDHNQTVIAGGGIVS